jgi:single-stranded-DNA-specific exonuclease
VAGLIASTLAEKYARPTIIFSSTDNPNILSASCRGPEDFHFANALKTLSHHLEKHGGHAGAAGFSVHRDKADAFVKDFADFVTEKRGKTPPLPVVFADILADISDFFLPDFEKISLAAPFGAGNPTPIFCLKNITLKDIRVIGQDGTHLAGNIEQASFRTDRNREEKKWSLPFVAFRFAHLFPNTKWEKPVDLLVSVEKERWKGREKLKARIVDICVVET